MRRLDKTSLFSGAACHARYAALMQGTARIPSAADDDPAARRAAMAELAAEKQAERDAARDAAETLAATQERVRLEASTRLARRAADRAEKQVVKSAAAKARATQQAERKAVQARNAEQLLRRKQRAAREKAEKQVAAEKAFRLREDFALSRFQGVNERSPDPRRGLGERDLRRLCRRRGIDERVGPEEGEVEVQGDMRDVLLGRLREADWGLKVVTLRVMVKERGMPAGGNKAQMVLQLASFEVRECGSWVGDGEGGEGKEVEVKGGDGDGA